MDKNLLGPKIPQAIDDGTMEQLTYVIKNFDDIQNWVNETSEEQLIRFYGCYSEYKYRQKVRDYVEIHFPDFIENKHLFETVATMSEEILIQKYKKNEIVTEFYRLIGLKQYKFSIFSRIVMFIIFIMSILFISVPILALLIGRDIDYIDWELKMVIAHIFFSIYVIYYLTIIRRVINGSYRNEKHLSILFTFFN